MKWMRKKWPEFNLTWKSTNAEKKRERLSSEDKEEKTTKKKTRIKSTPYPKGRTTRITDRII